MTKPKPEYIPLRVTSGVLMHIGAGIYNSAAGAIKELVTNSYDADATEVTITTNYPLFDEIRVVDNGTGMAAERFKQAMRNIGSSLKGTLEPDRVSSKHNRSVVGHLGIGLMALSQICTLAIIESQAEDSDVKFVAELDFSDFKRRETAQKVAAKLEVLKDRFGGIEEMERLLKKRGIDEDLKADVEAALQLARSANELIKHQAASNPDLEEQDGEQLGYCAIYPGLPAISGNHGTTITLKNIDRAVRDPLRDVGRNPKAIPLTHRELGWDEYRDVLAGSTWQELCERLRFSSAQLTYPSLPRYFQFLWELSAMTPVVYLPDGPVTILSSLMKHKKDELVSADFHLKVDNHSLSKPVLLPCGALARTEDKLEKKYDYTITDLTFDQMVDNERLKCQGYVYWQRKQIEPSTLRGVEIFIRNVGIGLYDSSLMNYSTINPGSRSMQISAEIYVDEGLERALNVDRNSFRETDAHYVALQQYLTDILGSTTRKDGVMGMAVESYWIRKERSNDLEENHHFIDLRAAVANASNGKIHLRVSASSGEAPYVIKEAHITVFDGSPRWPKSKPERRRSQRILLPILAAISAGASSKEIVRQLEESLLRN
jgi:Histidine kinase-, DNA gyrase B-, and HSP90-like ATPase